MAIIETENLKWLEPVLLLAGRIFDRATLSDFKQVTETGAFLLVNLRLLFD